MNIAPARSNDFIGFTPPHHANAVNRSLAGNV